MDGSQARIKFVRFKKRPAIVKRSKYVDYTVELEATILTILKDTGLSPHYADIMAIRHCKNESVELIVKRVPLVCELNGFVKRYGRKSPNLVTSLVCMTLCACEMLRQSTGIVHNDLHTSNVLIVKTRADVVEYKFPNGKTYRYETKGYFPIIIDFGYAYLPEHKVMAPACCMDVGHSTFEQDVLADARILTSVVARALARFGHVNAPIVRLVNETFKTIGVDRNGWFPKDTFTIVTDKMIEAVREVLSDRDGPYCESSFECEDMMNMLAAHSKPRVEQNDSDAKESTTLLIEFAKFKNLNYNLSQIKHALNTSSNLQTLCDSFYPIIKQTIDDNRKIRETLYSTIDVKTTLDVLDYLSNKVDYEYDEHVNVIKFDLNELMSDD